MHDTAKDYCLLSKITDVILEDEINYLKLTESLKSLKSLFIEASKADVFSDTYSEDLFLKTGKAIAPKWAEMCIDDMMRTKRFITGTYKAIEKVRKYKNGKPVTVLYVGTGPFATLVMPLITKYKPEELQLVLVEVNPISVAGLKNCIATFQAEAYIKNLYTVDATQLQPEEAEEIDILLVECMQCALKQEPQVAITHHLIPQNITLHVTLIDTEKKMEYLTNIETADIPAFYKKLKSVFILNKEEVHKRSLLQNHNNLAFSETVTLISEEEKEKFNSIVVTTDIQIFEEEKLSMDECALTLCHRVSEMERALPFKGIKTQYEVTETPGLKISWIT